MMSEAARALKDAGSITALTGAGISVESGIAPFRGKGGLWDEFDPEEYAHIRAFEKDPKKCWKLFKLQTEETRRAQPNPAHEALVDLEKHGLEGVITQNVDGLHQRGGSREVVELHGTLEQLECFECGHDHRTEDRLDEISEGEIPICECGGPLRPRVVLFGEQLPFAALRKAHELSQMCDAMVVVGTSAQVYPAAALPYTAKRSGSVIIEVNLQPTALTSNVTDHFLQGEAGKMMPTLSQEIG